MKVLVIGATGGTGREIVKQAKAANHQVTILVRSQPQADDALVGAKLVIGDARDPQALIQAVTGQQVVVDSLGSSMSGPFQQVHLFSESTKALIDAMKAASVRRLICITGIGAGDSQGHGGFMYDHLIQPLLLRGVYEDKNRQERLIEDSGLDWIIVRPAMLSDGERVGGTESITALGDFHGGSINRADVAAFVVEQISSDQWLHQRPLIFRKNSHHT